MTTKQINLTAILFFISTITSAQQFMCDIHPIPGRILTIQEEEQHLSPFNFNPSNKRRVEMWHADTITRNELKQLQRKILRLSKDKSIDTSSNYKELFIEADNWREEWNGNSTREHHILKNDTILKGSDFYSMVKKTPYLKPYNIRSYSYNQEYLIVKLCDFYIGNSTWGGSTIYYFKKIKE